MSQMETISFWFAVAIVILLVMMAVPPTRAFLEWGMSKNLFFAPFLRLLHIVVRAHQVVFRNLGTRAMVLPFIDKGGTEKK